MMLLLQVEQWTMDNAEQWKKKDWVSEFLDRRWFWRSATSLLNSGTFLLCSATFILFGSASGCTRIFQNLKRTTFVLLYVCNKDWQLHFWNILEKYNFIQDAILIDPNIRAGKCKPKIWFDDVGVVLWNQIDEEEKQGFTFRDAFQSLKLLQQSMLHICNKLNHIKDQESELGNIGTSRAEVVVE